MSTHFSFDVFLSHNANDKAQVRRLAERLRAAKMRVWFDEWVIRPGDDIYLAIERGLEAARVQVLCLSPAALESDWVRLERSTVLFRDPSNAGRRFIPLLLADCDLPDTLRRYKYVDYRMEADAAFEDLLTACRGAEEQEASLQTSGVRKTRVAQLDQDKKDDRRESLSDIQPLAVLDRTLKGHRDSVNSMAISPDGSWMVSGSDDDKIKIWDLKTGRCRSTLAGSTGEVNCVDAVPGGKVLSGSQGGEIQLWDVTTGEQLTKKHLPDCNIWDLTHLSKTSKVLSGGGVGKHLELCDLASLNTLWSIKTQETVNSVAASEDLGLALWGGIDNIELIKLEDGTRLGTLSGHQDIVWSIEITANGRYAVSGSADRTVKVWDLQAGTAIGTLEGHTFPVRAVSISPDGSLIVSTDFEKTRLWDWRSGKCLQVIDIRGASAHFSPDGSRLTIGTRKGQISVYRLTGARTTVAAEPSRRYVNAKVVLVGESAVGKTTLAHRMIEDRYVKTDSTHGMNVWRLELPLEPDDTMEREALLWDLAGQQDYRLIHQLYLGDTALALLLINPQKDDPFSEAGEWLKALRAAAATKNGEAEVAKLLIPTRLDVGGITVSQRKIDRFLKDNGFFAYLPTSAKRGDNCSDQQNGNQPSKLKQLIARHIPWDKLPLTSTPRLLSEIKNAIVAMRDKADIRLLRFAELCQRLEQALPDEKVDEAAVRTAVTLLANHGLVRPFKFGDLVLLRPDLLNGYAGAIIRAARAHKDEIGCVPEDAIFRDDFDFTGVERLLHRPDEELLLRALVQTLLDCSLCLRESEGGEWLLIFPSQYRRDRDIPSHPEIFVTYTFTGELQTIYTTLVVRLWYSRTFRKKELWQNAAEFTTSKDHSVGVVFEKLGDGEGKLSIFFDTGVPDELKVVFIEFVHWHLEKYGRDLRRERRYVCACGEPVKNLEAVRKRVQAGKNFITCQVCDEQVLFKDHIEDRLGSDQVVQKVVEMDQRATQGLDNQALEQILTGHMMAICGEANQIFRDLAKFDYGIDGEVEFKDSNGKASGQKIYLQLKSGASYLRTRKADGNEIFDVKDPRHLEYWVSQPVDVYLVIRQRDVATEQEAIRWMNVTRYLKERKDKRSRQIVFEGEKLDAPAVWRVRDGLIPRDRSVSPRKREAALGS